MRWWLRGIVALCSWRGIARADSDDEPLYKCAPAPETTKIRAYFTSSTSVAELVTWLMGFTCKVVVINSDVPKYVTKVVVLAPQPMTPKHAVGLFFDAMDAAGLAVTEKGDTIIIKLVPRFSKGCPDAAPPASASPSSPSSPSPSPPPPTGPKPAAAGTSTSTKKIDRGRDGAPGQPDPAPRAKALTTRICDGCRSFGQATGCNCEVHARVDDLIKQLTNPEAMRATLDDIERVKDSVCQDGLPRGLTTQPTCSCD
jgi:hypothetical protein